MNFFSDASTNYVIICFYNPNWARLDNKGIRNN